MVLDCEMSDKAANDQKKGLKRSLKEQEMMRNTSSGYLQEKIKHKSGFSQYFKLLLLLNYDFNIGFS